MDWRRVSRAPLSIRMRGCSLNVFMRRCATFLRHTTPCTRQLSPGTASCGRHLTCTHGRPFQRTEHVLPPMLPERTSQITENRAMAPKLRGLAVACSVSSCCLQRTNSGILY